MKAAVCMNKSMDTLLIENDALCRQLAKLQARASELIQKRSAEVEQLTTVVKYLSTVPPRNVSPITTRLNTSHHVGTPALLANSAAARASVPMSTADARHINVW